MKKDILLGLLLSAKLTTGAGTASGKVQSGKKAFQATVTGTGAVTATVRVEVSADATNWITLGTLTLSGTTTDTAGFASDAAWPYYRGYLAAVSGTGAAVDLVVAQE